MTLTRDTLIAHLLDHQRRHPEMGEWPVEIRDRWLVGTPQVLEHCEFDRVIILRGEPANICVRNDQRG